MKIMNCNDVNKELTEFIEGKLSSGKHNLIKSHIDNCKICSVSYQNLVNSLSLLKPTKNIEEQAFYYTRLKQKMENRTEANTSILDVLLGKKTMQVSLYLASVVIAVFIGIQIGSYSNNTNQLSELNQDEDYIQEFSKNQYLNDLEQETLEGVLINNDILIEE